MSGRSKGRRGSHAKSRGRGRGRARGRARAAPDDARGGPAPPPCPQLREETPAAAQAQVQAGAGVGGLETAAAAPPPPPPAGEGACPPPLACGLELWAQAVGGCEPAAPRRAPARASSLAERLGRDETLLRPAVTVPRPKNAPRVGNRRGGVRKKASEASGAAGRAPQAAAKAKEADECSSSSPKEEEEEDDDEGPGPQADEGSMGTLESVQHKLETMNAQADRSYLRLSRKFGQLRLHHLERRNRLIQDIPGFWGRAFQNHPQLSTFLSVKDKEVLRYLNNLEVEELGLARLGYKIKFYFDRNPYFQNRVLIKEYGCGPSNRVVSHTTPIQWLPGHDLQSMCQGNSENSGSFFRWFSNHIPIESDKVVEIINEELWPNPLQYYLMSEGAGGEKRKQVNRGSSRQAVKSGGIKN
ncbi:testis-specific Y-encoded-like protein 5 [Rhynchocyon petersi]